MRRSREATADLLLVCSSGGHLQQLLALRDAWGAYSHVWVTFDKSDARSLLGGERVVYAHWPTNRSLKNLFRNLVVAWRTLRDVRPPRRPDDRRRRRRAVRMAGAPPRRARRLRRELHAHRGAVADVPARRSGRRPRLRPVAGARGGRPQGALRRERVRAAMIFVSVGTHEAPFDRLLRAVGELAHRRGARRPARALGGPMRRGRRSSTTCRSTRWSSYVRRGAGGRHARRRRVGDARALERQAAVVMARLRRFDEHVDDHQLELARRLAEAGLVDLVEDGAGLAEALVRSATPPCGGDRDAVARRLASRLPGRDARRAHCGTAARLTPPARRPTPRHHATPPGALHQEYCAWQVPLTAVNIAYWTPLIVCTV